MLSIPLPYRILGALALAAGVFLAGWKTGNDQEHTRRVAEVATLKQGWAESSSRAEAAARQRLETAQALGDVLTRDLLKTESNLKQSETRRREIERRTTGRPCLNGGLVRLLNSAADPDTGNHLPEAPGSAPAEDGPAATDRDIAIWADNARTQYDICRTRLDALIDWEDRRP